MGVAEVIATDLVLSPFGADAGAMVDVARCAEESGFAGIWTLDHFSGAMIDRPWSRESFTLLGAFAAATERIRVGPLVANMVNRHVSLLASAASTLQSLSGGRAVLGIGTGAVPGSRFAGEQDAIGRVLGDADQRRRQLTETIDCLLLLWSGGGNYAGEFVRLQGLTGVVGPEPRPPIIVGASAEQTLRLACQRADGINLRVTANTAALVDLAVSLTSDRHFEVAVHDFIDWDHPSGGEVGPWVDRGVARRTLAIRPPFDLAAIAALGDRLNQ
jgi:alkanesulfonate monooxygenase SsuD/methylene tetrahydromethanopterin reductase-like flavin-dependent oxidoreductase (luciferase family)